MNLCPILNVTPDQLTWDIPLVQLNALEHAHLFREGVRLRRIRRPKRDQDRIDRAKALAKL